MTTVYIIRHAQAEGNLYRRCHGWYNSLITPKGHLQIAALAERFKNVHFDAVYSSDLFRTMTTAQAICRPHNLPLSLDPDLREVGMGIWEDWTWGDALNTERDSLAAFLRCDPDWHVDGSDTFPGVQKRFCTAVDGI
jgi:probable phosphoglycerate mutase